MKNLPGFLSSAIVLALAIRANADRIYITKPTKETQAFAGCPLEVGYRVQYSDLAILHWVQVEILNADDQVLQVIDNTTRSVWDATDREHEVTWTLPETWTSGVFTLRAYGNATYICTTEGVHGTCQLTLEDRQTFRVDVLEEDDECPSQLQVPSSDEYEEESVPGRLLKENRHNPIQPASTEEQEKEATTTASLPCHGEDDREIVRKLVAEMTDFDLEAGTYTTRGGAMLSLSQLAESTANLLRAALAQSNPQGLSPTALLAQLHQTPSLLVFPVIPPTSNSVKAILDTMHDSSSEVVQRKEEAAAEKKDTAATADPDAAGSTDTTTTTTTDSSESIDDNDDTVAETPQSMIGSMGEGVTSELARDLNQLQDKHAIDISPAGRTSAKKVTTLATTLGSTSFIAWMAMVFA